MQNLGRNLQHFGPFQPAQIGEDETEVLHIEENLCRDPRRGKEDQAELKYRETGGKDKKRAEREKKPFCPFRTILPVRTRRKTEKPFFLCLRTFCGLPDWHELPHQVLSRNGKRYRHVKCSKIMGDNTRYSGVPCGRICIVNGDEPVSAWLKTGDSALCLMRMAGTRHRFAGKAFSSV